MKQRRYQYNYIGGPMIQYACLARFFNPYTMEVAFARRHGFDLMQLWYDKDGLSLKKDPNPLQAIKEADYPTIIHGVLDICDIEAHIGILIDMMKTLNHHDLILHPICKSEPITEETIFKLSSVIGKIMPLFINEAMALYIENNSRLDPIFHKAEEVSILFKENPQAEFILDLAHIDDYDHLKKMVDIKMPKILHIADRHLEVIHEHLPIGKGNIDFEYIFKSILKDFKGKIIFEIIESDQAILDSKAMIEKILK